VSRNAQLYSAILWLFGSLCLAAPAPAGPLAAGSTSGLPYSGLAPRSRVVLVEDSEATRNLQPVPARVRLSFERGLTNLTGLGSVAASWLSLISTQDVVGIKVLASPGPSAGTRPALVQAIVQGLIEARVPPSNIVIWDKHLDDLRQAGFVAMAAQLGVRAAGALETGWDDKIFYEKPLPGHLVFSDLDFNGKDDNVGRKSHVSRLLTRELTRIINVSPLLNNNSCGVSGSLYSMALGSVDNSLRFEGDTARMEWALPEIYALREVGDRVALNVADALVAQYEGEQVSRLHYSTVLNQIRLSLDPVALDVLSIQELDRQRELRGLHAQSNTNILEIYKNASLLEIGVSEPRRIQVETLK
jgi:hypothetical protein